ncbi:hypothetical protein SM124_23730 [Bacillus sp. 31A1R]|uniref:Uncharacterized protein n=1 Tax=Robertmurraya mangrovi TaxID=3098077 RepID=A0ABU5J5J8_9BACI|nr:hypothetical protein [Bacillus sp. 31A1R]MDZ5474656.1 hypothetical protein [Bacillus sp. 31A1R]
MTVFARALDVITKDVNEENSMIISIFEKITTYMFRAAIVLGIPLVSYMIYQMFTSF